MLSYVTYVDITSKLYGAGCPTDQPCCRLLTARALGPTTLRRSCCSGHTEILSAMLNPKSPRPYQHGPRCSPKHLSRRHHQRAEPDTGLPKRGIGGLPRDTPCRCHGPDTSKEQLMFRVQAGISCFLQKPTTPERMVSQEGCPSELPQPQRLGAWKRRHPGLGLVEVKSLSSHSPDHDR